MMKHKVYLYLLFSMMISCGEKYTLVKNYVATIDNSNIKKDSVFRDTIFNFNFSRLTKPNSSSMEIDYKIPVEFKNSSFRIYFKGKGRTNQVYTNSSIVVSVLTGDSNKLLIFKPMPLKYAYTDVNKWCWFQDSLDVEPDREKKPYSYICVFPYLGNTTVEKFDMDTLIVDIKVKL